MLIEATFRATCRRCGARFGWRGTMADMPPCPGCGQAYNVVEAGRAPDRPDLHLDPLPLLTRNGRTQVALPSTRVVIATA